MAYENNDSLALADQSIISSNMPSFMGNTSLNLSISQSKNGLKTSEATLVDKQLDVPTGSVDSDDSSEEQMQSSRFSLQGKEDPMLDTSFNEGFYDSILKEDEEEEELLRFGTLDWLGVVFPFLRSKNYYLYKKGRSIIENNSDITIIMRKLQEFEMFKRLILDKEQEELFRSLPKPNLTNLNTIVEEDCESEASKTSNLS